MGWKTLENASKAPWRRRAGETLDGIDRRGKGRPIKKSHHVTIVLFSGCRLALAGQQAGAPARLAATLFRDSQRERWQAHPKKGNPGKEPQQIAVSAS